MSKFRVMVVKKNGQSVGVRAATINGRTIVLALRDAPEQMNWYDAVKLGIPSKEDWTAIAENFDAVNKALVRAGGEPLKKSWYWSSSGYSYNHAWESNFVSSFGLDWGYKYYSLYVRPVLAF